MQNKIEACMKYKKEVTFLIQRRRHNLKFFYPEQVETDRPNNNKKQWPKISPFLSYKLRMEPFHGAFHVNSLNLHFLLTCKRSRALSSPKRCSLNVIFMYTVALRTLYNFTYIPVYETPPLTTPKSRTTTRR